MFPVGFALPTTRLYTRHDQLVTFTKYFMSEGTTRISGIKEISRASGASEKSNGTASAGGYRG